MATPFATIEQNDTILQIIQDAAAEIHQIQPTTLNSNSKDIIRWLACARRAGRDLRRKYLWPALKKRLTFTMTTALEYPLTVDFDKQIFDTFWEVNEYKPIMGPLPEREWEARKNGLVGSSPWLQFKIEGQKIAFISSSDGESVVFPFQSTNWLLPEKEWTSGGSVTAGEYIFSGTDVYYVSVGGTLGTTAPTLTTSRSAVTNGAASLIYSKYDRVVEDGAVPLLDADLLTLGIAWRWAQQGGLDYESLEAFYHSQVSTRVADLRGAGQFLIGDGCPGARFINEDDIPQTGWGI